jgi:hypothetical protein
MDTNYYQIHNGDIVFVGVCLHYIKTNPVLIAKRLEISILQLYMYVSLMWLHVVMY